MTHTIVVFRLQDCAPSMSAICQALNNWTRFQKPLTPDLPAVTTTAQTSMLTGVSPEQHGIVANGWYFDDLNEILPLATKRASHPSALLWEQIRDQGQHLSVMKYCWWYAMNSSADAVLTPRPAYHADGSKSPDCYAWPLDLKETIDAETWCISVIPLLGSHR